MFCLSHAQQRSYMYMRQTVLSMVLHYSNDLQVVVMCQEMKQCTNKGKGEGDCKLVHEFKNARFKKDFANVSWGRKCIEHFS